VRRVEYLNMRILFCGEEFPEARRHLQEYAEKHAASCITEIVSCPRPTLHVAVEHADVVIPLMSRIDAALMDAGRFRLVQQWGAGLEGVDLEAARQKGIRVANVPASGSNADSVAEHAVLLTIALLRDLPKCQAHVRAGLLGIPLGNMLAGRTVCLYGLGSIARATAQRLRPFGVRLIGITRDPQAEKVAEFKLDACYSVADREAALARTDILILCSRMTQETRGVIDAAALRAMPEGSYLINAARGGLVNYDALCTALRSEHLAGAGLDVYWEEPISPDDPILTLPNVIATPHIAGVTDRSYAEIAAVVANNIDRLRRGLEPQNCVV
jgi:phosphoglycerate dehydrogenase-like enzyme